MTEELKQVSGESETVADTGVMDGAALQTDEDTVIEGSTGAVSVMGQVARLINPPPAGQTDVIRLAPGERVELATNPAAVNQIGRASCRDRVCQYVEISGVAGSLKKKN